MKRVFLIALVAGGVAFAAENVEPLALVQTIALDGVEGRIDHMCIDPESNRLYVAALGNNSVEVIDLAAGKRVDMFKDVREPQGMAFVPESKGVAVASGQDGKCRFLGSSLIQLGVIGKMNDADNVRYDAAAKRVYVGYGSGALAVIDPVGPAKLSEIALDGHPESFQLEKGGRRVFVNVPAAKHIAVIDRDSGKVVARWPVDLAKENFPMALDETDHRLLVGCRRPAKMLVIDTDSGKVVSAVDCCGDTDDLFYDAARKRVYVTGGEGCVSVLAQTDANHYELLTRVPTAPGARTSYYAPSTSRLYVAVPHRGNQEAAIRVYEARP